jgi:hypothetical protein
VWLVELALLPVARIPLPRAPEVDGYFKRLIDVVVAKQAVTARKSTLDFNMEEGYDSLIKCSRLRIFTVRSLDRFFDVSSTATLQSWLVHVPLVRLQIALYFCARMRSTLGRSLCLVRFTSCIKLTS